MIAEVDIFDAEAEAFHETKPGTVENLCHELRGAVNFVDDSQGFAGCENGGQGFGFFGADYVGWKFDLGIENVAVEEENGAEGLILGRCGNVLFGGEVGEKGSNFGDAHIFGVTFVVEEDVAFDPIFVGLFRTVGVVFESNGIGNLFEEFFACVGRYVSWILHIDLCIEGFYNHLM